MRKPKGEVSFGRLKAIAIGNVNRNNEEYLHQEEGPRNSSISKKPLSVHKSIVKCWV